ncbi:PREDICTED: uncharacterized protein LOC108561175 [Nicrophorus vespilloides]|uniref:Uncharacterized protein LOC108561175 n=1 Tax=Nicrophorus vespilloides TaxID=110193 RepID=A0ABM1MIT2_NICVS|nr:PREDICTED: uncharacterized protein LOC108561175 [Nicrophorus vespilloides]
MMKMFVWIVLVLLVEARMSSGSGPVSCARPAYEKCVRIADPLIKEAQLVFPDNMEDIDKVCRTWNRFVDCLKRYTDECFTAQQRRQFNKAVENPIESVHQMCMQPRYQKEYLQYAPCIKSTITERSHCGAHYNLLVEHVSQGEIVSKATLCCSHDRFKQCVERETRQLCDRGVPDGPASQFSGQIIDKALSFLQDQCINYIPNSGDCVTISTDLTAPSTFGAAVSSFPTTPSEVYPWSTIQQDNNAVERKEIPSSRIPPMRPSTIVPWLPSSSPTPDFVDTSSTSSSSSTPQFLGSRTRPGSYGRSSSWSDVPSTISSSSNPETVFNVPRAPSSQRPPDWATMSTWSVINSKQPSLETTKRFPFESSAGTETWYPAAGNQLSNEVDEPNQQGLSYNKNSSSQRSTMHATLAFGCLLLAYLFVF